MGIFSEQPIHRKLGMVLILLLPALPFAQEIRYVEPSVKVDFKAEGSILQFFRTGEERDSVEAHLLIPEGPGYRACYVATLHPEGGPPNVESAFRVQPQGEDREGLAVLVRYEVFHPALETEGDLYQTLIFADTSCNGQGLERLSDLEAKVPMGFVGWREGQEVDHPYTSAEAIRKVIE